MEEDFCLFAEPVGACEREACEQCHQTAKNINHSLAGPPSNFFGSCFAFFHWPSPTIHYIRSLVQIKSHAQKVIKRYDNGEDVFLRLDENIVRMEAIVAQIHDHMKNEGIAIPPAVQGALTREKKKPKMVDVREQIVAASALCQLSQPIPSPLDKPLPQQAFALPTDPAEIRNIVLGSSGVSSNVVKL